MGFDLRGIRFEPGLRYTYWGPKRWRNGEVSTNDVSRNQLDAIVGITF
ncbi:MAG: hypothetical protein R2724_32935 [Bryobacterales bacterium]